MWIALEKNFVMLKQSILSLTMLHVEISLLIEFHNDKISFAQ